MDQKPEEEFVLWLERGLPNPNKVRVHLLISNHGIISLFNSEDIASPDVTPFI
jgi:hypothetical protein